MDLEVHAENLAKEWKENLVKAEEILKDVLVEKDQDVLDVLEDHTKVIKKNQDVQENIKKGGSNLNKSKLFSQYTVQELKDVLIDSLPHNHPNYDFLVSSINSMNKIQLKNQLTKRLKRTGAPNARSIENAMDVVSRNPDPFSNITVNQISPRNNSITKQKPLLTRSKANISTYY